MMKFDLYNRVALIEDVPENGLRRGDVVTLVDHVVAPEGTQGYAIEIFNAVGETIALTRVPESSLEPLRADEVFSVRPLAA